MFRIFQPLHCNSWPIQAHEEFKRLARETIKRDWAFDRMNTEKVERRSLIRRLMPVASRLCDGGRFLQNDGESGSDALCSPKTRFRDYSLSLLIAPEMVHSHLSSSLHLGHLGD
jgi:hypothetical protein